MDFNNFNRFINSIKHDGKQPILTDEEIALVGDKEAYNFVNLSPAQKLNILEARLVEKTLRGESIEDITFAIETIRNGLQKGVIPNRSKANTIDIRLPIVSEIGDILSDVGFFAKTIITFSGLFVSLIILLPDPVIAPLLVSVGHRCIEIEKEDGTVLKNKSAFCKGFESAARFFIDYKKLEE